MSPRHQHRTTRPLPAQIADAGQSLLALGAREATLAGQLTRLVEVLAVEAARSPRFAHALATALATGETQPTGATVAGPAHEPTRPGTQGAAASEVAGGGVGKSRSGRSGRRNPGPLDPFSVYAEGGEAGLRQALAGLGLEQLRDVVAEHGMDHDKLAMKWKSTDRVIQRIVERVEAVSSKGFAFRSGASGARADQPADHLAADAVDQPTAGGTP